jgi:hypothetical protein
VIIRRFVTLLKDIGTHISIIHFNTTCIMEEIVMQDQKEAFIVYFKRSPFSRSRPNEPERDVFNGIRMDEVLANLINDSISSTGVRSSEISDLITGCALQADENWTYGGKHPALLSKLPVSVPAMAIDRACSSSLNAISIGAMEIMTGNADIVLAGGMEHMTHVPLSNNPHIKPNIKLLVRPEYARLDMNTGYSMGLTAEKLAHMRRFDAFCDAGLKVIGPLDVAVPQGRGHIRFRSHRRDRQEKPECYEACARTKTGTC